MLLTFAQLEALAIGAGFNATLAPTMAAIALAESGGDPSALNPNDNGGTQSSYGLWQISTGTHYPPDPNWYVPETNAALAYGKYQSQGLQAWGTYTSGAYRAFLESNTMTLNLIPNSAAMSEFIAGYNGDCGETATLCLLHVIDPTKYPLTSGWLSTIDLWEIHAGLASANGSEPLSSIASYLTNQGINFTNYGYSAAPSWDWQSALAASGGIRPILFEYAAAAQLPGDEAGVQYHFNVCLAWDETNGYGLFADGDNIVERSGGSALVKYTRGDLVNAKICGMLVANYSLGGPVSSMGSVPTGWTDDGKTLRAPNGIPVTLGFRDWVLSHNWNAGDIPLDVAQAGQVEVGNPSLGSGTYQHFRMSGQLSWTSKMNVYETWQGQEELALRNAVNAANAQIADLQKQLAAAQAKPAIPDVSGNLSQIIVDAQGIISQANSIKSTLGE